MSTKTEPRTKTGRTRGTAEPKVNGVVVVKDEPLPSSLKAGNGKQIVFGGYRLLTLADGSTVHGCGQCPNSTDFTGTKGQVQVHRAEKHGMRSGGRPRKTAPADAFVIPESIRAMTMDELLMLAGEIENLGEMCRQLTEDRDEYRKRAHTAEMQVRRWERAFTNLGLMTKENME